MMAEPTDTTRRALISMAPAATLAAFLAGAAAAETKPAGESPIIALMHDWERMLASIEGDMTDEETADVTDQMLAIEHRMLDLPSRDGADFAAKVIVHTGRGTFGLSEKGTNILMAEAEQLLGGVI